MFVIYLAVFGLSRIG